MLTRLIPPSHCLAALLCLCLTGCASHSELKAPCSYEQRSGCGKVISPAYD